MASSTLDGALVETDARSRVVLPGRPNARYLVHEDPDGTLILEPAVVMTKAELAYRNSPELQRIVAEGRAHPERRVPIEQARARRAARKAAEVHDAEVAAAQ
jgi:hypothetical protein